MDGQETWRLEREPLGVELTPGEALLALSGQEHPFALTGIWAGGGAILGADPVRVAGPQEDPFELWDQLPELDHDPPAGSVGGGWFGWLGYGAGSLIEDLPPQPPRPNPLPAAQLAFYDHVLRLDKDGHWWFEALVAPGSESRTEGRLAELSSLLASYERKDPRSHVDLPSVFRPVGPGAKGHLTAVARCRERIRSGELFQANLRVRLETEWRGDLAALYATAVERTEPAFGAAFLAPEGGVASLSPELFLRRRGDRVETAPIKGTAARPDDSAQADAIRQRLLESGKDVAEHVMIVDVARNDLGRVCRPGSVTAPRIPDAEPHPGLWHLVSVVSGRLNPKASDADLLRATFPPCSVTGAPKIQAMRAIAELEPLGREVFTGAMGFSSPAAGLELNVAIRTFEAAGGRLWLDVGGGIVNDSDPQRELDECLIKGRPLIDAIGARIETSEPDGLANDPVGIPWALDGEPDRPDPARGLVETLAVEDGVPQHLELHLERLGHGLNRLGGSVDLEDLGRRTLSAAAELGEGALRLHTGPDGRSSVIERPVTARNLPIELTAVLLPGGLGGYKWADRRLVDGLGTSGITPLLIDLDGSVLEASWGNVWIVEGSRLLTPPADGRILPGITRRLVLAAGSWEGLSAAEESFDLDRLMSADRVLVSSSIAGLVPAVLSGETARHRDR